MSQIAWNLEEVRKRLEAAARRAGRNPAAVKLVAVKAREKIAALGPGVTWHLVGHLQTNKAKAAVELFQLIHSVDRLHLAQALEKAAAHQQKIQEILLQVNLAGEESKSGATPEAAPELLREIARLPHLRVLGLMIMPPFLDPEAVRPYFRALRELRDRLRQLDLGPLPELSMGMSEDFEVAVEEGATLVRVGTAIFGRR
ncbi:MAG: YggS family pyridoxal phosphate-dependent enzyme [Deltaproteobacteria bacterium]|nr:YggS family pyridoxal phosphate-dependent enzyme [Deltaproteobacteria bacterium]